MTRYYLGGRLVWWVRSHGTGDKANPVAHAIRNGGALCNSRPQNGGPSQQSPEATGGRACQRCVNKLKKEGATWATTPSKKA